jgi:hypothetical protein
MAGFVTTNMDHLIRSELWSSQLKDVLLDELAAQKYVDWITEFPDGEQFTIPSVGEAEVDNYVEDTAVTYRAMDTGEFVFTINKYKSAATYITDKMKQDSYYSAKLMSTFVPKHNRALQVTLETDILALANTIQTTSAVNAINGVDHRWVASGANETMNIADFAKAHLALKVANVPMTNLVAIVDPTVEFTLGTLTNLVNVSNNPRWEGIVSTGIATGMKFLVNIMGFDVYTSNYLPTANETITATGGAARTTTAGKANIFFSATPGDVLPFKGCIRQAPRVESERNKDFQRDEFVTTMRYGVKGYRQENFVAVLADTDQIVTV